MAAGSVGTYYAYRCYFVGASVYIAVACVGAAVPAAKGGIFVGAAIFAAIPGRNCLCRSGGRHRERHRGRDDRSYRGGLVLRAIAWAWRFCGSGGIRRDSRLRVLVLEGTKNHGCERNAA